MCYDSLSQARKAYGFSGLERQLKVSTRLIRYYKELNEPASPSLRHELEIYSDIMNTLNEKYAVTGHRIMFNWKTGRIVAKSI